jgi:GNAT superfamily N-acetyltransferase
MTRHADVPRVHVQELGPDRYDVLDAVLGGLSPTSRHHRFHSPIPRMTPQVREALAVVDGHDHIAVAAFTDAGEPIGIARLIAVPDGPSELAVEVVDEWQRRGVGVRLVRAVVELGRAAGHRWVVADVLAENVAAQVLFLLLFPWAAVAGDGPELRFTAALGAPGADLPRAA